MNKKLVVILGPTSSGKSDLAVKLALRLSSEQAKNRLNMKLRGLTRPVSSPLSAERRRINGAEIISADSRQVYKGMDIGTGKITKKEMQGIPHHLLDIASPKRRFTIAQYQKLALKEISKIYKKGKLPILCGGTGFYIQAVADGVLIPEIPPDWKLRKRLEKQSCEELFSTLIKLDPRRAKSIDKKNPRRLIRALEIVLKTKKPVSELKFNRQFLALFIGIEKPFDKLRLLIKKRLLKRFRQGMIKEVVRLHEAGVSWKKLEEFGLEYRLISLYLQKQMDRKEMIQRMQKENEHYAKRQLTWFKKDNRISWVKNIKEAEKLVRKFLK